MSDKSEVSPEVARDAAIYHGVVGFAWGCLAFGMVVVGVVVVWSWLR